MELIGSGAGRRAPTSLAALLFVLVFTASAAPARAQSATGDDTQFWHDSQVTFGIQKKVDGLLLGGFRLSDDLGRFAQARGGGGLVFKLNRHFTISPVVALISHRKAGGPGELERRLWLDGAVTVPIGRWTLSDRNRIERRLRINGDTTRYRNRIQVEHPIKLGDIELSLFAYDEVLYSWTEDDRLHNRMAVGASKRISKRASLDVYYLRQPDRHATGLNVVGTLLKVRL